MTVATDSGRSATGPHRVAMVAFEDAQILDITGPLEVFARTARWLADHKRIEPPAYAVEIVARRHGPVMSSSGISIVANRSFADAGRIDTLLVAGGVGYAEAAKDHALLEWLTSTSANVRRMGSICTGAIVLGAAGLLARRRATTHWGYLQELKRVDPSTTIEPDAIFVRDGNLFTSAGVTAGMDLALALVEEDWGRSVALAVAQELVLFLKRPGGQSQFSRLLAAQRDQDRFGRLEEWVLDNLSRDLGVPAMAAHMAMSVRQFSRSFHAEMATTPARYVETVRVEEAKRQLSEGRANLKSVARNCGFGDVQRMRRAFRRHLGITPNEFQQRFG